MHWRNNNKKILNGRKEKYRNRKILIHTLLAADNGDGDDLELEDSLGKHSLEDLLWNVVSLEELDESTSSWRSTLLLSLSSSTLDIDSLDVVLDKAKQKF